MQSHMTKVCMQEAMNKFSLLVWSQNPCPFCTAHTEDSPLIPQRAPDVSSNPQFKIYSIQIPGLLRWRPRNQGNTLSVLIYPTHTVGVRPPGQLAGSGCDQSPAIPEPREVGVHLGQAPHLPQGMTPPFLTLPTRPPALILSGLQGH